MNRRLQEIMDQLRDEQGSTTAEFAMVTLAAVNALQHTQIRVNLACLGERGCSSDPASTKQHQQSCGLVTAYRYPVAA
ncbi:hypothetical protein AARI_24930 [Glutamicibacter arilaitensis Re117]|uniref:Uncharacterized protein n=1 Tax=Glutamicibacter arilaitensis (strain DSM 16368 / CIP 108037 / IAM 15318 / JCM 13566 / NCIMB 14258 / Re117) TaxID=861360 RepID=A0ABP1U3Z0_GLUAR|nr:hypothetical protein AARI_24930 [Glutamicibacter arilaitensis Re117]